MFKHILIVFLVSMVPLIELRGAIPYGVLYGLPLWLTFLVAIMGNMLPVPVIYFLARKVLVWGQDKPVIGRFFSFCLRKGEAAGEKLKAKAAARWKPRPGVAWWWRCCCLWASLCRAPAHGQGHWRPAF